MPVEFDASRFLDQYREEIRERLDRVSDVLMAIEAHPDSDTLAELVREFHTIKGAASMMGFPRVAQLAHKLEDSALAAKSAGSVLTSDQINAMLREVDELRSLLDEGTPGGGKAGGDPEREPPDPSGDTQSVRVSSAYLHLMASRASHMLSCRSMADELAMSLYNCCKLAAEQLQRWRELQEQVEYLERLHAGRPGGSVDGILGVSTGLSRLKRVLDRAYDKYIDLIERLMISASDIYTTMVAAQMVSISAIGVYLHRAVRDIAERQGKKIDFRFIGTDTRISQPILSELSEALLHLVRNAADHGVEDPQTRVALGKPETANITLRAVNEGDHVRFVLEDDGRGFDIDAVVRKARAMGVLKEAAETLPKEQLEALVFADGFTTKDAIGEFSGRGVGLGIAKKKIESIGGTMELQSTSSEGTRFVIVVPSSSFLLKALVCQVGNSFICIPISYVTSVDRGSRAEWVALEGRQLVRLNGVTYPLRRVPGLFGQAYDASDNCFLVTMRVLDRVFAMAVDRVIDETEVLVKPLGSLFKRVATFIGAAVLGEGRIGLVVSMPALAGDSDALTAQVSAAEYGAGELEPARKQTYRVLVVDDSLTSRELLRSILESEGLETVGATDGIDALEKLRMSVFDLVVTDIEMPGVDGFTLCKKIREGPPAYRDVPVVIVTTRATAEDRKRGLAVGANAYVVKKTFDQGNLLETVHRLISRDIGVR